MITQDMLDRFTGTENYWQYMGGLKLTDGVKFLAYEGKCGWLLDIIASYQPKVWNEPFQVWNLKVSQDNKAVVTMTDGNSDKAIITQKIDYTDFAMPSVKLYVIDKVALLPSEY
jgi:hypothetical protein